MPKLELISFDLDRTLFDFERTLNEALQAVTVFLAAETGIVVSVNQLHKRRNDLSKTHRGRSMDMLALRRESFASFVSERSNRLEIIDGATFAFAEVRFKQLHLYEGAERVLRDIAKTYKLAAVTNGNSDPEQTPLAGLFETIVFSEECGFQKPDTQIYEVMMSRAGIECSATVCHVGDSLIEDIQAGNNLGFATVWFNPYSKHNETGIIPTYEIAALNQLSRVINSHDS